MQWPDLSLAKNLIPPGGALRYSTVHTYCTFGIKMHLKLGERFSSGSHGNIFFDIFLMQAQR